jgi:hypothetical protein
MTLRRLALIGLVVSSLSAFAQQTTWGSVVLPPDYDAGKAYPLLIDLDDNLPDRYIIAAMDGVFNLPPDQQAKAIQDFQTVSSGTPAQQFQWWLETMFPGNAAKTNAFILARINADGIPRDYRTAAGFSAVIEGYERKVLAALTTLTTTRRVDASKVYLSGFSIGGDVAWAVVLRNPTKLRGAILQSSRASYRASTAVYSSLASGKARFAVVIGDKDDASRIKGARDASALLKSVKVPSVFCLTPGGTHKPAPLDVYSSALSFILLGQASAGGSACRAL